MFNLRNGDLLKEKKEYLIERFTTKQGIFNFLSITYIWWWLIMKYSQQTFDFIFNSLNGIPTEFLRVYITYLGLGLFYSLIGFGISVVIISIYNVLFGRK